MPNTDEDEPIELDRKLVTCNQNNKPLYSCNTRNIVKTIRSRLHKKVYYHIRVQSIEETNHWEWEEERGRVERGEGGLLDKKREWKTRDCD